MSEIPPNEDRSLIDRYEKNSGLAEHMGYFVRLRDNMFNTLSRIMSGVYTDRLADEISDLRMQQINLIDRFQEITDTILDQPNRGKAIDSWVQFVQHDEQVRSDQFFIFCGLELFEPTDEKELYRQAGSYTKRLQQGEETYFSNPAEEAHRKVNFIDYMPTDVDIADYKPEEDEYGEWVIDTFSDKLMTSVDYLMNYAPEESLAAYNAESEEFDRSQELNLEQFANDIYDDVDTYFARNSVPEQSLKSNDRYCEINLTSDEIKRIGPMLETYAIDAPHSVELKLVGLNPNKYTNIDGGGALITMQHKDAVDDGIITSLYSVWLYPDGKQPTVACKDVVKAGDSVNQGYVYSNKEPLDQYEQKALRIMINMI